MGQITNEVRSMWVSHVVEHPALGLGSGQDLRAMRLSPTSWGICLEFSLPSPSALPPTHMSVHSLTLK